MLLGLVSKLENALLGSRRWYVVLALATGFGAAMALLGWAAAVGGTPSLFGADPVVFGLAFGVPAFVVGFICLAKASSRESR